MKNKIISIVEAIVAIVMIVSIKAISPVCAGMLELVSGKQVHMKCYYTSVVLVLLAVLLLVNALICYVRKDQIGSGIMSVVLAAFVFLALHDIIGIGICIKTEMACHMTAIFAKLSALIEIVLGIISILEGLRIEKI